MRQAWSESTEKLTFSGFAESGALSGSLSFDYYTRVQTITYTVIAPNVFNLQPTGEVGRRFNIRQEGASNLVTTQEVQTISSSRETIGPVSRISVTARRIIEQGNLPAIGFSAFNGVTVNGVPLSNPWARR